ncbi:polysaccharide deacetylase family protein [Thermophagus sp. OGC60D27]|uniref:polysaccharide deacetylase family protein n=1 Tax=Thermophagus sp. OGC60D27 TaxID=3458415 RepID=UPI004037BAAE
MNMTVACRRRAFLNRRSEWITQPPLLMRRLFPKRVLWRAKVDDKRIFLTFDDGPVPGITPWVIDQLRKYGFRATFFCVGDNVRKYPRIFSQLKQASFETAIHGFHHRPAHRLTRAEFDTELRRSIELNSHACWYRPPHGILIPWRASQIGKYHLNIAMWDVLSQDYDRTLNPETIIDNVIGHVRPGSLIVFHDSLKAWPNLKKALPVVLSWLSEKGYQTDILSSLNQNIRKL